MDGIRSRTAALPNVQLRGALALLLAACGREPAPAARTITTTPPNEPSAAPARDAGSICSSDPTPLGAGLVVEHHVLAATPAAGTPCIDVVRADLARFQLRILSASHDGAARTAPDWRDAFHLAVVINAGMFHESGAPVGLLVEDGVALGADNAKMSGFVAFGARSPDDPPALATGRSCAGFDLADLRRRYHSIVQSYRLLGCDGAALPWADPKQYSAAAIGVDRAGRAVFLHARAAVTMSELSAALASLDLTGALFLEGGPEASLVARGDAGSLERIGSYETHFVENDSNAVFWSLPNVIGLEPIPR
jgi:hypothetical protein